MKMKKNTKVKNKTMNIIQKLRNLIFGKSKVVEAPAPVVVEAPAPVVVETPTPVEVKPTVQEMVAIQEAPAPKPKPKRKYHKKKKSTGESK
jgi:cell division septation protein DedD